VATYFGLFSQPPPLFSHSALNTKKLDVRNPWFLTDIVFFPTERKLEGERGQGGQC